MERKVRIYTTPSCHYCQKAKDFLAERGVEYEAYDVSKDTDALKEMKKISGGARTVPVISVCDEVMVGFDRSALEKALQCLDGNP